MRERNFFTPRGSWNQFYDHIAVLFVSISKTPDLCPLLHPGQKRKFRYQSTSYHRIFQVFPSSLSVVAFQPSALTSEPTQPQTQLADHNEGQPSQLVALNRQEGHTHTAPPPVAVSLSPCSVIWSRCPVRRPGRRLMRLDRQAACSMQ